MKYIIKSIRKTEVIVYFTNESDILIEFKNDNEKDEFLNILKLRFASLCPKIHLKVFGVPSNTLKEYRSQGGKGYAFENEPADVYRIKNEEIAT